MSKKIPDYVEVIKRMKEYDEKIKQNEKKIEKIMEKTKNITEKIKISHKTQPKSDGSFDSNYQKMILCALEVINLGFERHSIIDIILSYQIRKLQLADAGIMRIIDEEIENSGTINEETKITFKKIQEEIKKKPSKVFAPNLNLSFINQSMTGADF